MEMNQINAGAHYPAPSPFSPATGVLLAALAYSDNLSGDLNIHLPNWTLVWQGKVTEDGNTGFIALDPTGQYYGMGFRGSLPPLDILEDWYAFANWVLEDLDVVTEVDWQYTNSGTAKISHGAHTAFTNITGMTNVLTDSKLNLFDYLKTNAVANNKHVIIAGHSLGGNIANVFASYFVSALAQAGITYLNTSLFTFAAPAPGDSGFSRDLDSKITNAWHYENVNDIVPKFPVFSSVLEAATLYFPSPSSSKITVTYHGDTLSLYDGVLVLGTLLVPYGYKQQARNYKVFLNALDSSYQRDTIKDWFLQAGSQHALVNYANYLGVNLDRKLAARSSVI